MGKQVRGADLMKRFKKNKCFSTKVFKGIRDGVLMTGLWSAKPKIVANIIIKKKKDFL